MQAKPPHTRRVFMQQRLPTPSVDEAPVVGTVACQFRFVHQRPLAAKRMVVVPTTAYGRNRPIVLM